MRAGVVDDRARRILARKDGGPGVEILCQLERAQDPLAVARRQPLQRGRFDVDGGPLDAELTRKPRRAAHDVVGAGAGAHTAKQRRFGLPHPIDCLVGSIGLDIVFDAVGGAAQRELAQRHQVALAEEVARRALDLLGNVHLARLEPCEQVVGRDVDQHHLVGIVEHRCREPFPGQ